MIKLHERDFESIYVGKDGKCACGCAGDYVYPERLRGHGKEVRGYELHDDEISDKRMKTRLARLARLIEAGHADSVTGQYISALDGTRRVTAYFDRTGIR